MKKILSHKVAENFSVSAETYDGAASFQRHSADIFSEFIFSSLTGKNPPLKILEIGCGTGFLTERLMAAMPSASFTVSDISGAMLRKCEEKTLALKNRKNIKAEYLVSDMSDGVKDGNFDMIVSALAFQWAENIHSSLGKLRKKLADGGTVFFSTLTEGTFAGIADVFRSAGVKYPGPEMLSLGHIRDVCLSVFSQAGTRSGVFTEEHVSVLEFLKHIKATGAGNATGETLSASDLRRVITSAGNRSVSAEYHLAFFECVK